MKPRLISRAIVVVLGAGLSVSAFLASKRRKQLLAGSAALLAGFALGNAPQWGSWLFLGIAPNPAIAPTCPTDVFVRTRLLMREILPALWGIPPLPYFGRLNTSALVLWIIVVVLVVASLFAFLWINRRSLWSLMTLAPLSQEDQKAALFGLLFAIPLTMALLGGNTINVFSVRYLTIAWQASSVFLALLFARISYKSNLLAALCVLFWSFQMGFMSQRDGGTPSVDGAGVYSPQAVSALEQFLEQRHVQGGYADYWVAYTLDFVTEERLTIAPYNGIDRYPAYTRKVDSLPVQAYLFWRGTLPADRTLHDLARVLGQNDVVGGAGPAFPRVQESVGRMSVLERETVANWDVWIVALKP